MKKSVMTMDEKIFNLCVESAKNSKNGYTFDLKEVWQTARKKYKVAKQAVIDAFEIITKEHEVKKGETEGTFVLVELMPKEEKKESDRMKRFCELKKKHSDAILLFRCGDFYEALEDDAVECAKILGITLTKSEKTGERMAGFPFHALDTYLPKLVRSGKRCAIVEELDAKPAVQKFEKAEHPGEVKEVKEEKKQPKHVLTECEVINLKAQKAARELYPNTFTRFGFARLDSTSGKEFKNADDAIRGKADMNNLLYVIKVVEGVQYTGTTRINAYENFLAAVAI